jgi:Family of unknown function (DUF6093)
MTVGSLVMQLRGFAREVLIDTCTVTRADTTPTFDENTGQYTLDPATAVFTGACFVPPRSTEQPVIYGETERVVLPYRILIDHTATGIREGDILTLTACTYDPELVGRPLRIRTVAKDSVNITQTVEAEDVT